MLKLKPQYWAMTFLSVTAFLRQFKPRKSKPMPRAREAVAAAGTPLWTPAERLAQSIYYKVF